MKQNSEIIHKYEQGLKKNEQKEQLQLIAHLKTIFKINKQMWFLPAYTQLQSLYLFNLTRSLEAFPSSSTAWRRRSSFYTERT